MKDNPNYIQADYLKDDMLIFYRNQLRWSKFAKYFFIFTTCLTITLWYGSVSYRQGAKFMADTHKGMQYEKDNTPYCYINGTYYQISDFNTKKMIVKIKRGK